MVAAISEGNGEITPYASVEITPYQSTQINTLADPTLNLDDTVDRNISVTMTTGAESVTVNDTIVGNSVIPAVFGETALDLRDTPLDGLLLTSASVSETVTSTDSLNAAAAMVSAISEGTSEITPYASIQITVYQSTQINTIIDAALNLDDTVNRS
jgi:hypothetical protein